MSRLTPIALLVLACSAHSGGGAPGPARTPASAVELAPGVLVSADRATAYLMAPGGGVEGVNLQTGEPRWQSDAADRPLGIAGGRLLAQIDLPGPGGELRVAVLDPKSGTAVRAAVAVPLPPGVKPLIDRTPDLGFDVRARADGAELLLEWSFVTHPVTGVAPPPDRSPATRRSHGGARIDVTSGTAVVLGPAQLEERPPDRLRSVLEGGRRPWRDGDSWRALDSRREAGGALRVTLRRWSTGGEEGLPVELFRGRAAGALPAADGRHVMVGAAAAAGAAHPWLWRLYGASAGEPAGTIPAERSLAPFLLLTPEAVLHLAQPAGRRQGERWVERPLRLRAARLENGAELWTRPVRDVAYRGPLPPGGAG